MEFPLKKSILSAPRKIKKEIAGVEFVSEVEPSGNAGYSFGFSSEPPKDPPMASFNQPSTVQAASAQQKISATGQAPAPPPLSPVGTQSQVSQPQQQSAADSLFGSANRKQNKLDVRIGSSVIAIFVVR